VIDSRFLNIDDYLDMLKQRQAEQQNDLLRIQTQEYINFIRDFVETTNIISTDFYVVVPLETIEVSGTAEGVSSTGSLLSRIGFGKKAASMEKNNSNITRTSLCKEWSL
jgi:hypothetical protein